MKKKALVTLVILSCMDVKFGDVAFIYNYGLK